MRDFHSSEQEFENVVEVDGIRAFVGIADFEYQCVLEMDTEDGKLQFGCDTSDLMGFCKAFIQSPSTEQGGQTA